MSGFQVTLNGRFWVTPEGPMPNYHGKESPSVRACVLVIFQACMIATTTELLSISKFPKCSEAVGKDVRAVSSVEELVSRIDSEGPHMCVAFVHSRFT